MTFDWQHFKIIRKKTGFHTKPDFSCMAKFSKTDLGILPYLRWSSLQQLVTMELTTNGQFLRVTAVTRSSLLAKLKSDENGHALKAGISRYTFLFCRHVFTFFRKRRLLPVLLTFCFITKINYKNENWYHCQFHLLEFY